MSNIQTLFDGIIPGPTGKQASSGSQFAGGTNSRLNADWAYSVISADKKIRGSLVAMRQRSRELAGNNDYAIRFLNKAKQNVIGPNGVTLQMDLDEELIPGAEKLNEAIEDAWECYSEKATADGKMSLVDAAQLWLVSKMQDGETFLRKVKGYPYNKFRFAQQFIDPDVVDVQFNRYRQVFQDGTVQNEIRMGVELDDWRRPVAYWLLDGHPSERVGWKRLRMTAEEVEHSYVFKLINQSRGIPWMHTAMTRMNMLGGYEEAELVAARVEACKMGVFTSKTGEDYVGKKNDKTGDIEVNVEPASFFSLPEGVDLKSWDPQHPNAAFPEFVRAMLRGAAMGLDTSYATLSGDLRDVNFSSLRQGVLDEREGWKVLQTFAVQHYYKPVFADWLPMAVLTGQVELPAKLPLEMVLEAACWVPRGWDWVDPRTDVDADIKAVRGGMSTLQAVAAKRGRDWREDIDQRAKEIAYAKEQGVPIDLTTQGAGGVEGDTAAEEQKGAGNNQNEPPAKPAKKASLGMVRTNA